MSLILLAKQKFTIDHSLAKQNSLLTCIFFSFKHLTPSVIIYQSCSNTGFFFELTSTIWHNLTDNPK
jgi:hypothetical protein